MLACNSIGLALRGPSPLLPSKQQQQQQHVSQKENSGNIKFYESFTQIATLLPINASTGPGPGQRSHSECLPATHLHTYHPVACSPRFLLPLQLCFFFVVPFRLQFLYCCKMFSFQRSYIYFANTHTHKKVVCSPFNNPALSTALFSPLPACCKPSQLPCPAHASSCRHCSLRLCRLYWVFAAVCIFSLCVCMCVQLHLYSGMSVCVSVCLCVRCVFCLPK